MRQQTTILLVEEDANVRQALGEALVSEDYQVAFATNGHEALRQLPQGRDPRIDIVLFDLTSTQGRGWATFSRLSSLHPELPVVILTATRGEQMPLDAPGCVA